LATTRLTAWRGKARRGRLATGWRRREMVRVSFGGGVVDGVEGEGEAGHCMEGEGDGEGG
jgi:hypothetical protein